jgi:hypothetical protein
MEYNVLLAHLLCHDHGFSPSKAFLWLLSAILADNRMKGDSINPPIKYYKALDGLRG